MTEDEVLELLRSLPGTRVTTATEDSGAPEAAWGDSFAIYDPDGDLPPARQQPFATVVVRDVPGWDVESRLDRPGVFRVNVAVGTARSRELRLDPAPDYTAEDVLLPHPQYAAQGWVAVVRPGPRTADLLRGLVGEAHAAAERRWERRRSMPAEDG
jgi:hypothetical protein